MLEMLAGAGILLVGVIIGASIASMKTKTGDDLYYSEQGFRLLRIVLRGSGRLSEAQIDNVVNDLSDHGISFGFGKARQHTRLGEDK